MEASPSFKLLSKPSVFFSPSYFSPFSPPHSASAQDWVHTGTNLGAPKIRLAAADFKMVGNDAALLATRSKPSIRCSFLTSQTPASSTWFLKVWLQL